MKKLLLFIGGIVAFFVMLHMIGPMIFLGLSLLLLYLVCKRFLKSSSVGGKIGWIILGAILLSSAFANLYALTGLVAAFALYWIIKHWREDKTEAKPTDDPFTNFEKEWQDLNKY